MADRRGTSGTRLQLEERVLADLDVDETGVPLLVVGGSRVLGRDVFERGRGVKKSAPVWGASNGIGAKTASLSGIRL